MQMKSYLIPLLGITACLFTTAGCAKDGGGTIVGGPAVTINSIYELNKTVDELDSHAGEEFYSVLQPDYDYNILITPDMLGVDQPIYSRIKKTADGNYLLFYHTPRIGTRTYVSRSSDMINWSKGEVLFERRQITTPNGSDERRYSTCDATVLSNGDVIAVVSYRSNKGYYYFHEYSGVAMRRSTDNGRTWGEERDIYIGANWEPYLLELPSGELQCYFTDADPLHNSQGIPFWNSGTSMVVSGDKGYSWEPTGTRGCYKVIRQYKYDNEGIRIYTDQMPCVRMLNDGKTLMGFVEARLEAGPPVSTSGSNYKMSLVYGNNDWVRLTGDAVGPIERQDNLFDGAAGYLAQFRSGETLISCTLSGVFSMKMGDCTGRKFNHKSWNADWYQPFTRKGYWGSCEVFDTHEAVGTIVASSNNVSAGIQLCRFVLNHRIDAPYSDITPDGANGDWKHDSALFIGNPNGAKTVFRAARDNSNLYIMVERRDKYVVTGDDIELCLHDGESTQLDAGSLKLCISPEGLVSANRYVNGAWAEASVAGLKVENTIEGIMDDGRSDTGYISEVAIPLSELGITGEYVRFNSVVSDGGRNETFTKAVASKPATWMMIKLAKH